jgi:predicted nucleotidyltransferase
MLILLSEKRPMSTTTAQGLAANILATLRAHEAELRQSGITRLSLFGSVARGEAGPASDIDLAAELNPEAGIGLVALSALERRLSHLLGRRVDLLPEPVEKPRLSANIDRDRLRAF